MRWAPASKRRKPGEGTRKPPKPKPPKDEDEKEADEDD